MRRTRLVLLAVAVAAAVLGCSSASPDAASVPVTRPAAAARPPAVSPTEGDDGHPRRGRRGREGGSARQQGATLPAGIPLPPGVVTSVADGAGHWSALVVVNGSAPDAQAAAVAFYVGHAFHRDSANVVHGQGYRISMFAETRDHSPTEANLTVVVARQP